MLSSLKQKARVAVRAEERQNIGIRQPRFDSTGQRAIQYICKQLRILSEDGKIPKKLEFVTVALGQRALCLDWIDTHVWPQTRDPVKSSPSSRSRNKAQRKRKRRNKRSKSKGKHKGQQHSTRASNEKHHSHSKCSEQSNVKQEKVERDSDSEDNMDDAALFKLLKFRFKNKVSYDRALKFGDSIFVSWTNQWYKYFDGVIVETLLVQRNGIQLTHEQRDKLRNIARKTYWIHVLHANVGEFKQKRATYLFCDRSFEHYSRGLYQLLKQLFDNETFDQLLETTKREKALVRKAHKPKSNKKFNESVFREQTIKALKEYAGRELRAYKKKYGLFDPSKLNLFLDSDFSHADSGTTDDDADDDDEGSNNTGNSTITHVANVSGNSGNDDNDTMSSLSTLSILASQMGAGTVDSRRSASSTSLGNRAESQPVYDQLAWAFPLKEETESLAPMDWASVDALSAFGGTGSQTRSSSEWSEMKFDSRSMNTVHSNLMRNCDDPGMPAMLSQSGIPPALALRGEEQEREQKREQKQEQDRYEELSQAMPMPSAQWQATQTHFQSRQDETRQAASSVRSVLPTLVEDMNHQNQGMGHYDYSRDQSTRLSNSNGSRLPPLPFEPPLLPPGVQQPRLARAPAMQSMKPELFVSQTPWTRDQGMAASGQASHVPMPTQPQYQYSRGRAPFGHGTHLGAQTQFSLSFDDAMTEPQYRHVQQRHRQYEQTERLSGPIGMGTTHTPSYGPTRGGQHNNSLRRFNVFGFDNVGRHGVPDMSSAAYCAIDNISGNTNPGMIRNQSVVNGGHHWDDQGYRNSSHMSNESNYNMNGNGHNDMTRDDIYNALNGCGRCTCHDTVLNDTTDHVNNTDNTCHWNNITV